MTRRNRHEVPTVITVAFGLLIGAVTSASLWVLTQRSFDAEAFRRTNYRGAELVTSVGVLIPVTVLMAAALARVVVAADDVIAFWDLLTAGTVVAATGFTLLGLFDDIGGVGQSGGFRGHLSSLRRGEVTSGMVKLAGGAAVGLLTVSVMQQSNGTVVGLLRDGATVALAANLGNLFDRAPGRAIKVTTVLFVVLAVVAWSSVLLMPAVAIGAGIGLLTVDLRERVMLGDAGANPLGAMCGVAALVAFKDPAQRWVVVAVFLGLNLLSEVVSYSSVIDAVGPLRWLDRLGSRRTG